MYIQSSSSCISLPCTAHLEKPSPVCTCLSIQRQSPVFLEMAVRTSISTVAVSPYSSAFRRSTVNERFKTYNAYIVSSRSTLNKYQISRFGAPKAVPGKQMVF